MSNILKAFKAKQRAIRRIIARYRSNPADIEQLEQDVFLTCFSMELTEKISKPEHLLFRVARNLALNEAQKKINTTAASMPDFEDSAVYIDDNQHTAEDQFDGRQKLAIFAETLAELSEQERRVFVMRRIEGKRFEQIAASLNISVRTAERRAASALLQCYKLLQAKGIDPTEFGAELKGSARSDAPMTKPVRRIGERNGRRRDDE